MFKLNKMLPGLSIRNKLIIAFTGLSLLPILIVGIYGIVTNTKMMEHDAIQNLNHDLSLLQENTANLMAGIENDLRLVQNSYLNQSLRNTPNENQQNLLNTLKPERFITRSG